MKLTQAAIPFLTLLVPAFGQMRENTDPRLTCGARAGDRRWERSCEMRETRLPSTQRLEVLAQPNGGVSIRGWNRAEILVRARVETQAATEAEAKTLASQVNVQAGAGRVTAAGPTPEGHKDRWWSVTYEVFVPHRIDLKATSVNGGVDIADVEGDITYATVNGGVTLARLAGNVRGETKNGGVNVEMSGDRWQGAGLDAQTVNGGVNVQLPTNYSAKIMASTVNGGVHSDFPGQGDSSRRPRHAEFNVGAGGAPIRIVTQNGGVNIRKKAI